MATVQAERSSAEAEPAGLKANAIGFLDAHMIVIGAHGESPLRGAILGSTPHQLLHLADRPVFVVPIDGGARDGG